MFTYQGERIKQVSTRAWYQALARASGTYLRFRDKLSKPDLVIHQTRILLRELPPHLQSMATFTLQTGLRAANVTGLTWDQVDLARKLAWIHPDQAKARKAIPVPLNETAVQVLRAPTRKVTAQIRHNHRISAAQPDCKS